MIDLNPNLQKLAPNYLFSQITQEKEKYLQDNPGSELISLAIGDTCMPIPSSIAEAIQEYAAELATDRGFKGYQAVGGNSSLKQLIAENIYSSQMEAEEIFISDGAKCDTARLQQFFGSDVSIAIQDPVYPVYRDGSLLSGVKRIETIPCIPENGFLPGTLPKTDLIYLCNPNNPTGKALTKEQLEQVVHWAIEAKSLILYDAAYSSFITDPSLPKSIYEIPQAKKVAIELQSLSKHAGFTGVRLGWTVVPKEIRLRNKDSLHSHWTRFISTTYNGPSRLAEAGGYAALTDGAKECAQIRRGYLSQAKVLKEVLTSSGYRCYGGVNAPFLWVDVRPKKSWEAFAQFLHQMQILTVPGSGFGKNGEGFLRLSCFLKPNQAKEAASRLHLNRVVSL